MATLWERIRALEGTSLPTVSGREAFEVIGVDDGRVRVVPQSSGKPRQIPRWQFERAEELGLIAANTRPIEIRQAGVSEYDPAHAAAIIRADVEADIDNHNQ